MQWKRNGGGENLFRGTKIPGVNSDGCIRKGTGWELLGRRGVGADQGELHSLKKNVLKKDQRTSLFAEEN